MMVQRVLTCNDIKSARKAMVGSGIFVFIQFFIFMLIGFLIREVIPENLPINQLRISGLLFALIGFIIVWYFKG